jgi:uncharacterized protein involved in exopolysaccharide biosynthesis
MDGRPGLTTTERAPVSLLDHAGVVWRYRWLILAICVVVVSVVTVLTITTPKSYQATSTILIPKEGGSAISRLASLGLAERVTGVQLPSFTPNRDSLLGILRSRTVANAVVERFDLQKRYQKKFRQDTIDRLQSITDIIVSREGVISVTLEDVDPVLAANMANFYIEEVDRLASQFGTGEASRQRVFVSEQLARARKDLEGLEDTLRRFQERNRAVVLQDQTRGAIEAAARLKGEIIAAEVQLQVMRNFATESNPDVVSVRRRVEEMKRQLAQMQYGDGLAARASADGDGSARGEYYVPFARVPAVGLELARQTRDVKVQETLVTLLAQQLESAKLAEARDAPLVQVLDRAVPAERPFKPRLPVNVAVAAVASLFVALCLAFSLEYVRTLRAARSRTA